MIPQAFAVREGVSEPISSLSCSAETMYSTSNGGVFGLAVGHEELLPVIDLAGLETRILDLLKLVRKLMKP